MPMLQPTVLTDFVAHLFLAAGAPPAAAQLVARSLVDSDLAGHELHGVVRVRQYLDSIAAGDIHPAATPAIAEERAAITTVDAQRSFGQVAARFAMELTIAKARTHGLAATALRNCNHVGRLGEWVEMAAVESLIGLAFCSVGGGRGAVAPHGGAARLLGTNPLAAAIPVAGRSPLVVDFATSAVAEGKLRVARNRAASVPEGWILGPDGQPSTVPDDFYLGGMLLPAAGHKGYGLAMLVELLGGILTGCGGPAAPGLISNNCVLFIVLAIEAFRPPTAFLEDAAALCAKAKAVPPAAGFGEVLLPGEPEQRSAADRAADIPLDAATWEQLTTAAATLRVDVPADSIR